jgi:glycosyltransferase involved in cell wall biosynthesis
VLRLNLAAMRRADVLIAVSETTRRDLLAAGFDRSDIRVIHNSNLNPPRVADGDRWNGVDLRTTFVHFGAGKYAKHSELALQAFDQTVGVDSSARLLLVGPGASVLAAKAKNASAVRAYDHISAAEVEFLYENVAAVLMPSRYEGFGLPVLEAQERDCLIITSDGGALDEIMYDGALKLRRPIAVDDLAATMMRVLHDATFREDMTKRGRSNAARFSTERATNAYKAFYDEICR